AWLERDGATASGGSPSLGEAAEAGRSAARGVLTRAATDGSNSPWLGTVPSGPGLWHGTPQLPQWTQVRPWLMASPSALRAPPPPAFGSARYLAALAEVRAVSDARTADQMA